MSAMMESLEGRELFSVSLTPAAPSPTPVPYPNTTIEAKKRQADHYTDRGHQDGGYELDDAHAVTG